MEVIFIFNIEPHYQMKFINAIVRHRSFIRDWQLIREIDVSLLKHLHAIITVENGHLQRIEFESDGQSISNFNVWVNQPEGIIQHQLQTSEQCTCLPEVIVHVANKLNEMNINLHHVVRIDWKGGHYSS